MSGSFRRLYGAYSLIYRRFQLLALAVQQVGVIAQGRYLVEHLPAGTLIGHDGDEPVLAPHEQTVLIMPSRRLWLGKTAVRLAYPVPV